MSSFARRDVMREFGVGEAITIFIFQQFRQLLLK
jgi:hypothetical protein